MQDYSRLFIRALKMMNFILPTRSLLESPYTINIFRYGVVSLEKKVLFGRKLDGFDFKM